MSTFQRLLLALFPRSWRADVIAHSQRWIVICPCGGERSIWELGGIRYRAAGNPRKWLRCPKCRRRTWQRVEYRAGLGPTERSDGVAGEVR